MATPRWALEKIQQSEKQLHITELILEGTNKKVLTDLPREVLQLSHLTDLDLSNNKLSRLPRSITKLTNLTWLNLKNNKLTDVPESIIKLRNLTWLDLSNNNITNLPKSLAELKKLRWLYLNDNKLSILPEWITELENLKWLYLDNNQLTTPPPEIANRGIEEIREYFRQLRYQGKDQLYEAKLLILGEGGAGKTSLAKKIEDSNYELQDEEKSTEGVDISPWLFPLEDVSRNFQVNIWDFGGQEIYHATHQFFLTKRSLYVLVADTRKDDTDFYYWLNIVELLSDNSPLIIVKNEKQDRHREINERQLRGQFNNLKEILATNLASNRGLERVKIEIKHYIRNLPHIGSVLPKTWVRVREMLEKDIRNYISRDEYLILCRENGFIKREDSLQLSGFLHDIGVFLHFQDEPLLEKIVMLKPKWGTDAVYKVLDNKMVIKNLGRFTWADLKKIWYAPEYENMHSELLQLMMKFKLCYEIPNKRGTYVAPQLLTENQPDYEWDEKENLLLRYTYEFMPKGILMQFIVVMNENIWKQKYVWKSGVVLIREDKIREPKKRIDITYAEVIEYYEKREIQIRVSGEHKKELMTIVIYELDKIHSTYKRLKYDKKIPCNCAKCKSALEPHFYLFEILRKFAEDGRDQIQCVQSYDMVNVRSLIDDVFGRSDQKDDQKEEKPVTQNIYNINNSTIGNIIIDSSIQNSFNKADSANIPAELKETLKQLSQAVDFMSKELPKKQAAEIAGYLEKLVDEAIKLKPNNKWYSVSIEGLIQAAENLDKLGQPVIKLSRKVLALLTGDVIK